MSEPRDLVAKAMGTMDRAKQQNLILAAAVLVLADWVEVQRKVLETQTRS